MDRQQCGHDWRQVSAGWQKQSKSGKTGTSAIVSKINIKEK